MGMIETDFAATLAICGGIAALILPPYIEAYRHWIINGFKYPDIGFSTHPNNEQALRGHARFLIDQAGGQLDILSGRLNASVWDEKVAQTLQQRLNQKPQLRVRILTGPEIVGHGNVHPFYSACRDNSDQVLVAILDERFPVQGVRADSSNILRTIGLSERELLPAVTHYQHYDGVVRNEGVAFKRAFDSLWNKADKNYPARIVPQAV